MIPKSMPMYLSILDHKDNNFMANEDKKEPVKRVYLLSISDAFSHEQIWARPFKLRQAIIVGVSAFVLVAALVFAIVAYTPVRTVIPGYPSAATKRQAVQNAVRIDSLEREILQWQLYTENLRRVVAGEEPLKMDSLIRQRRTPLKGEVAIDPQLDSMLKARLNALDYDEE